MPKKKNSKPELKVVFDTSVLYTQVASDLVRSELRKLIESNSKHVDLSIQWYLPSVVIDERRYQMQKKAIELLPALNRLERLLGHSLNINEDVLKDRVDGAINKQLGELNAMCLGVETNDVDWKAVIQRSVFRHPPFDAGENEKGFRDSIIAESFLQLVNKSPSTPSICRLAIVTDDVLLTQYVNESTKDVNNVRVLANLDELESLINTLVSEVTEEFVGEVKSKANVLFFVKGNEQSLYFKEKVSDKIRQDYDKQLKETQTPGLLRENGTWWIGQPVFMKKEKQRLYWVTPISVEATISKYVADPSLANAGLRASLGEGETKNSLADIVGMISSMRTKKVEVNKGASRFEVQWSTSITQSKRLVSPKIDKIVFVDNKWDEQGFGIGQK